MNFEFATAGRILFGEGRLGEAGSLAAGLGSRALVVQGSGDRAATLLARLEEQGVESRTLRIPEEPSVPTVEEGVARARQEGCDFVVAIGGGSVMDAGKAIAALLTNPGAAMDYLEVVGKGMPLRHPPAPLMAIPTTAGTGAEVTRNAVLAVPERSVKVSLRHALMLPRVALVDPELTYSLPPAITASTGLDALTQCIEPFVSPAASPLTDGLTREGMRRAAGALQRACANGADGAARRDMAIASLCGGLALANGKLGAVHGIAGPLGGMYPVPHGVACAALLAPVMEANIRALRARAPEAPALTRYREVARILTGRDDAKPEEGAAWVRALVEALPLPPLTSFDLDSTALVEKAQRASSMKGNPVELTREELQALLASL